MKLKIFSYFSNQRKALGLPPAPDLTFFSIIHPDILSTIPGSFGGPLEQLASLYHAWRDSAAHYDYVGFENAARPLFLLPMQTRWLAVHSPGLLGLRLTALQAREIWEMLIYPHSFAEYERARIAFDDADNLRFCRWVSRIDIAAPSAATPDSLRALHTDGDWSDFVTLLRRYSAFKSAPDEVFNLKQWPRHNSFIMRSDLFMEYATILFETLAEYLDAGPAPSPRFPEYMAERVLGVFLAARLHANPLLATASVPTLRVVPPEAPSSPPAGFNPAGYILINRDLAPGISALEHYLRFGWREGREWDMP